MRLWKMRTLGLGLAGMTLAIAIAAPAQADAGKQAFGRATFDDGTTLDVMMRYERDLTTGELWTFSFNIVGMTECQAMGTLGNGFVSAARCATPFKLGGNHDTQADSDLRLGQYNVTMEYGGKTGTFNENVLPDAGL